jgi:hypothetical protein
MRMDLIAAHGDWASRNVNTAHGDLLWLVGTGLVIFVALGGYQLASYGIYKWLRGAGLSKDSDTRYLQAKSLSRSKLIMDATAAAVALTAIVGAALRILL